MFAILKIKEKDRKVTFRCHSRYYPIFYIVTRLVGVLIVVCTYFLSEYSILAVLIPQVMVIFFYLKLGPHGRFKSFVTIAGLCIQFVPIVAIAVFLVARYMKNSMVSTIGAFVILSLFLIGFGVSIARLVLKYR